jgi:hypothetical protein
MKPVFMHLFGAAEDVFGSFEVPEEEREGVRILFAYYNYEDYSGSAFVLFRKGKKLYEVHGGHCSCDGLEHQWRPEPTTIKSLKASLKLGLGRAYGYGEKREEWPNEFADELAATLKDLSASKTRAKRIKKAKQK